MLTRGARESQVIYNKDAAYLVHMLDIFEGSRVIEAGTGSGHLTSVLASRVRAKQGGKIYSYEMSETRQAVARKNLQSWGLIQNVELILGSIENGFKQENVDVVFLDMREPWLYLDSVYKALVPSGKFAVLLPTMNQIIKLVEEMDKSYKFTEVRVEELLVRGYKCNPERMRPMDTMQAHTGYLLFSRTLHSSAIEHLKKQKETEDSNEVTYLSFFRKDRKGRGRVSKAVIKKQQKEQELQEQNNEVAQAQMSEDNGEEKVITIMDEQDKKE